MNTEAIEYKNTIDFLTKSLPAYHRIGAAAYKADLKNTEAMMAHLGHPERQLTAIHVAGTNGKGSVSHFLASILQEAGYKTGLYTSPHLTDFRERIRINGKKIPCDKVVDFVERNKSFFVNNELSFFEMTVGMAYDYFYSEHVDIAVVEVGMGGRLDSTNVITPILSIVTNIGFDHTQFLGDTLPKIAAEKAGIIKPGIPVVIGETHRETAPVFEEVAKQKSASIYFADVSFSVCEHGDSGMEMKADILCRNKPYMRGIVTPLCGIYQRKNIATVAQSFEILRNIGLHISEKNFTDGVRNVVKNTHLRGRWQQVGSDPTVICETAHNADGVEMLVKKLDTLHYETLHLVYGCVNDKDYRSILRMLPENAKYYFTRPSVERGLDSAILSAAAKETGRVGDSFPSVVEALAAARRKATKNDVIVVTGSIFLVADLMSYMNEPDDD